MQRYIQPNWRTSAVFVSRLSRITPRAVKIRTTAVSTGVVLFTLGALSSFPVRAQKQSAISPAAAESTVLTIIGKNAAAIIKAFGKPITDEADGSFRSLGYKRSGFKKFEFKVRDPHALMEEQRRKPETAFLDAEGRGPISDAEGFKILGLSQSQWTTVKSDRPDRHKYKFKSYELSFHTKTRGTTGATTLIVLFKN